jgi:hypothetical protein
MFAYAEDGRAQLAFASMHDEAAQCVAEEIGRLRALSYEELLRYEDHALHCEMLSAAGDVLIRETQVFSDSGGKGGDLRVLVDVWNPEGGRWGVVGSIAKDDFIKAPDGSFVDE